MIEAKVDYRLIALAERAVTVEDVVKYSNGSVAVQEICKTLIVRGKKSRDKYAILLRGEDRLDFSLAKAEFGEAIEVASPQEVSEAAGVEPGAVCPVLLRVPLLVDAQVLSLEKFNCGSGDHAFGLEMKTADLAKAVNYKVLNLATRK